MGPYLRFNLNLEKMVKLLLVEDDSGIRETLKDILEFSGYDVMTAVNGKDGFDKIMEFKPEMVICDINMPVLNGYELLGAINQRLAPEMLPSFIFLTAKVDITDIRKGMNLGADDYVTKPFDHNELLTIIQLRLEKRAVRASSNPANDSQGVKTDANKPTYTGDKEFNRIAIPSSEGLQLINIHEIIRCEADRAYCTFYLENKTRLTISKPLKDFETLLLSKNFIKTHKSHIVNVDHIEKYIKGASGHLVLSDKSIVPISARKKEEVLSHLRQI